METPLSSNARVNLRQKRFRENHSDGRSVLSPFSTPCSSTDDMNELWSSNSLSSIRKRKKVFAPRNGIYNEPGYLNPCKESKKDREFHGTIRRYKDLKRSCLHRHFERCRLQSKRETLKAISGHTRYKNFGIRKNLDFMKEWKEGSSISTGFNFLHDTSPSKLAVCELVVARDIIFCSFYNGLAIAVDRKSFEFLCILNTSSDEVVRSLFYNKIADSIITVSVLISERCVDLYCRSTQLKLIKRGCPKGGFRIFESETLRWPGFVEFDESNDKVMSYNANNKVYKVWDLNNYKMLYSLADSGITELKISPGLLLLVYTNRRVRSKTRINTRIKRTPTTEVKLQLPVKILDIATGTVLQKINHCLDDENSLEFIDLFCGKILLKEKKNCLKIIDIATAKRVSVIGTENVVPSGFMFLYSVKLFLSFEPGKLVVWDFAGTRIARFDEAVSKCCQDGALTAICVSQDQKLLFSCSEKKIHVSDIESGKLLATVSSTKFRHKFGLEECDSFLKEKQLREAAMSNITQICYDKESNEIITGNQDGKLFVWSTC